MFIRLRAWMRTMEAVHLLTVPLATAHQITHVFFAHPGKCLRERDSTQFDFADTGFRFYQS
jgi:hypothetical protein